MVGMGWRLPVDWVGLIEGVERVSNLDVDKREEKTLAKTIHGRAVTRALAMVSESSMRADANAHPPQNDRSTLPRCYAPADTALPDRLWID